MQIKIPCEPFRCSNEYFVKKTEEKKLRPFGPGALVNTLAEIAESYLNIINL